MDEKQTDTTVSDPSNDEQGDEEEKVIPPAGGETPEPKEYMIPKHRFDEVNEKRKELERQLKEMSEKAKPDEDPSEVRARQYIRDQIKAVTEELSSQEENSKREAEEKLQEEIDTLTPNPKFDEKAVLEFMNKHELYELPLTKVFELWQTAGSMKSTKPKPKMPSALKTSDEVKKTPASSSDKPLWQLVEEAKKNAGLS